jgi:hypothetical protein
VKKGRPHDWCHKNGPLPFHINIAKCKLNSRYSRQEVTGLTVNRVVNTRRSYVRQIRAILHAMEKYGVEDAQKEHNLKYRSSNKATKEASIIHIMQGKLSFLRSVKGEYDPVYIKYSDQFRIFCPSYRPEENRMPPQTDGKVKDVFLCHASEDKMEVIEPLINALDTQGITYWYDRAQVKWGDSLVAKINEGLSSSKYVIVIISQSFTNKNWPVREMNTALSIEISSGEKKVLPLLVGTNEERDEISKKYPIVMEKLYLTWEKDPERIAHELKELFKTNST